MIFENYYTHPTRFERTVSVFAGLGYLVFNDRIDDDEARHVKIVVNKTRELDSRFIKRFPNLRTIVIQGNEDWMMNFDTSETDLDIVTLDADRGYDVAEQAIVLMLEGLKKIYQLKRPRHVFALRNLRGWLFPRNAAEVGGEHNWVRITTNTAYDKRVGIVGYGLIGRQIHKRLIGFRCEIFYHSRRRYSHPVEKRLGISFLDLEPMFQTCDIIFLQLPYHENTAGLIDRDVISGCKKDLVLINCGRAGVIDRDALYSTLRRNRRMFYGSDVFWREPMPLFDKYRLLSNCLITPHMSESLEEGPPDMLALVEEAVQTIGERP